MGSIQGLVRHREGASRSVFSSTMFGSRQSQWPANPPVTVKLSLVQLFSAPRNLVKAPPSGSVPVLLH